MDLIDKQKTQFFREDIVRFEEKFKKLPGTLVGHEMDKEMCPLKHTFVDGAYVREIFMPKGTIITSKIHKILHPFFVLKGRCSVLTEDGVQEIQAPYQGITKPGTKRVLYMHEDTVWVTIHVTKETDLDKIEKQIIAKSFEELDCPNKYLVFNKIKTWGEKMFGKIIKFVSCFLPKAYCNERGSWVALGATAISTAGAIGGAALSKNHGNPEANITQLSDYEESEGARKLWWEKLQEWGGQPGYGAIAPDWADIWNQAQKKVRDYYSGTATQPGAISKIRSSAARRGVSDSPAVDAEVTKALVEQGGQLGTMASEQAVNEAAFSESGRQNWLSNVMGLSGQKPQYNVSQPTQQRGGAGEMIAGVGGSIGNALAQFQQQKWLEGILNKQNGGYPSISEKPYYGGGGGGW